jgi:hypothetical protein
MSSPDVAVFDESLHFEAPIFDECVCFDEAEYTRLLDNIATDDCEKAKVSIFWTPLSAAGTVWTGCVSFCNKELESNE